MHDEDNRWTSYILTMADSKQIHIECECLFVDSKLCYHQVPITSRAGRICWKCGMSHDIDNRFHHQSQSQEAIEFLKQGRKMHRS